MGDILYTTSNGIVFEQDSNEEYDKPWIIRWSYVSGLPGLAFAYGEYNARAHSGYIDHIVVQSESRQKGIGRQAVQATQELLLSLGATRVYGVAEPGSEPFWDRMGTPVGSGWGGHLPRISAKLASPPRRSAKKKASPILGGLR